MKFMLKLVGSVALSVVTTLIAREIVKIIDEEVAKRKKRKEELQIQEASIRA